MFVAGWLVFDGVHGFVTGDYVTPEEGEYAGQLGPWSKLFEAIDLDPRSHGVMAFHVGFGAAWLVAVGAFLRRTAQGSRWMLGFALASFWYLPVGLVLGLVQVALLLGPGRVFLVAAAAEHERRSRSRPRR